MNEGQLRDAMLRALRGKGGILWTVEHLTADRELIQRVPFHNLWPDAFCTSALDYIFRNQSQPATWYVGLKGAGAVAAGDTLASPGAWSEIAGAGTVYDGDRKAFTFSAASASGGVPTITGATAAEFTISTGVTGQNISGAITASVATGTAGLLGPSGDFGTALSVNATEIVRVTPSIVLDDDGVA